MWFKNAIFYRFTQPFTYTPEALEEKLSEKAFTPCGSQELSRFGWVSPSGDLSEMLVHAGNGFMLIAAQKEDKIIPTQVIRQQLDNKVKLIEDEQARKVYKKEKDQLKDEIVLDLLPRAFSKYQTTWALIAPEHNLFIVDASSHKRAEELLSHLRSLLGSLPVVLPDVNQSPSAVMSNWLEQPQDRYTGLEPLDECELRDSAVETAVIRCKGQDLESDEIRHHLEAGKRVVKLALEWQESLNFILQDDLCIKRIKLSDQLKEKMDQDSPDEAFAQFDADFVQMSLELTRLIPALTEAFGGEAQRP
ncbi:recombination-associated protein RdgC [Amphritea sp. 2_MG-2023]|jgi:recombination associated protein RdgC|uniref:recombination-associated protein RdgC n=1 Tax=Amphritea TaxID=515417 RepID=UPI001C07E024|nr:MULTISPECIES: recombination-associated protein RdgC [Amphritea]MBU2964465.1 recombination-associated protein RdgC [Amphritea atlantica]MDO6417793.1 recombination-associated protein RdgC [Amphritea sp. 2_MG-2023]MDX2421241.1 recombination-associated protein RdgC [Amphritea sp.]